MARVMVVEDDPASAEVLCKVLQKIGGHQVRVCESGDEVLRAARAGEVDAVVMDIRLPNTAVGGEQVDGLRLTRLLKSRPHTASVPVLLATAHAMRGDEARFLAESGADAYITKPITDFYDFVARIGGLVAASAGPGKSAEVI